MFSTRTVYATRTPWHVPVPSQFAVIFRPLPVSRAFKLKTGSSELQCMFTDEMPGAQRGFHPIRNPSTGWLKGSAGGAIIAGGAVHY